MPAIIEVKYFNTFLLKKVNDYENSQPTQPTEPVWDGSRGIPQVLGGYPRICLLYTSPSPRDKRQSRMPSCA